MYSSSGSGFCHGRGTESLLIYSLISTFYIAHASQQPSWVSCISYWVCVVQLLLIFGSRENGIGSMSPMGSPHPLTPSPNVGRRGTRIWLPLAQYWKRGLGVRAGDCLQNWHALNGITIGLSPVLSLLKFYFCYFFSNFIFRAMRTAIG